MIDKILDKYYTKKLKKFLNRELSKCLHEAVKRYLEVNKL